RYGIIRIVINDAFELALSDQPFFRDRTGYGAGAQLGRGNADPIRATGGIGESLPDLWRDLDLQLIGSPVEGLVEKVGRRDLEIAPARRGARKLQERRLKAAGKYRLIVGIEPLEGCVAGAAGHELRHIAGGQSAGVILSLEIDGDLGA